MSIIRSLFIMIALMTSSSLLAGKYSDYKFTQDRMIATNQNIILLSSFDDQDHVTAYSDYGTLLWNVSFQPKVLSWRIKDGLLYVFSKSRYKDATYITCVDPVTGTILWERP